MDYTKLTRTELLFIKNTTRDDNVYLAVLAELQSRTVEVPPNFTLGTA